MDLLLEDAVKRRLSARGVAAPDAVVVASAAEAVAPRAASAARSW